jgi:hypothetical protein
MHLQILLVIFVFALVQSMFGVGLLVFGTPTLLLMGYNFYETLSILLPCSIVVSLLQILKNRQRLDQKFLKRIFMFSIPSLVLGIFLLNSLSLSLSLKKVVGIFMLATLVLRVSLRLQNFIERVIRKTDGVVLISLGLIHGLSNLGGGLLTVYATSKFKTKEERLKLISVVYLIFASSQVLTLIALGRFQFFAYTPFAMLVAGTAYQFIGSKMFVHANNKIYQISISGLILVYGLILAIS